MLMVRVTGLAPRCTLNAIVELSTLRNGVGGGVIVNVAEIADTVPALKPSVRTPATPEIRKSVNVTTPPAAATVSVPPSVPPPVAIVAVTKVVLELTRLPAASWSSSTGCVESSAPSDAPAGWVRMTICRTAPGVTVTDTFALAEPLVAVIVEVPALSAVS